MNQEDFKQLLSTYGADSDRWPATLRPNALNLLDESESARTILASERELDELLDSASVEKTDVSQLRERILSKARPGLTDVFAQWFASNPWRSAVTACLPLAIGMMVGGATVGEASFGGRANNQLLENEEFFLMATSETAIEPVYWNSDE